MPTAPNCFGLLIWNGFPLTCFLWRILFLLAAVGFSLGLSCFKTAPSSQEKVAYGRDASSRTVFGVRCFQQVFHQPSGGKNTTGTADPSHGFYHQADGLQYLAMVYRCAVRGRILHRVSFPVR